MPKILLFRVAQDLSASLVSDLSRAGYDVATPQSADVRTVLQQQPDLILLQTDVRTLDCAWGGSCSSGDRRRYCCTKCPGQSQIECGPCFAAGESALADTYSRSASGARTKEPRSTESGIECFGEQAIGRVAGRECRPAQADLYLARRVPG